jgi:hypothetical protein
MMVPTHHINSYAEVQEDDAEFECEQQPRRGNSSRRALLKVAGFLTLLGCAGLVAARVSQKPFEQVTTARMLLESPEVVSMATQYHMEMRRQRGQSTDYAQEQTTRAIVDEEMKKQTPSERRLLDSVILTKDEQEGVKHVLRHMLDPRVRRLARDAGHHLIKSSQGAPMDSSAQKRQLQSYLSGRAAEVQQLRKDIFGGLPGRLGQRGQTGQLRGDVLPRRAQAVAFTTTAAMAMPQYGVSTTGGGMLDCNSVDEDIENAKGAASMMKMALGDQIKEMSKTTPAAKDASNALLPFLDFLQCINDMRKLNGKCQPLPTNPQEMMPNAEDMEKFEKCWEQFQSYVTKVMNDVGVDMK